MCTGVDRRRTPVAAGRDDLSETNARRRPPKEGPAMSRVLCDTAHPRATDNREGEGEEGTGEDIAVPQLASIQEKYEEAKACIADLAPASFPPAPDAGDPSLKTQAIDVRA